MACEFFKANERVNLISRKSINCVDNYLIFDEDEITSLSSKSCLFREKIFFVSSMIII